ncbi:hypothetical protein LEMLEM_LOCUS15866 [Lemmus lemmus]
MSCQRATEGQDDGIDHSCVKCHLQRRT